MAHLDTQLKRMGKAACLEDATPATAVYRLYLRGWTKRCVKILGSSAASRARAGVSHTWRVHSDKLHQIGSQEKRHKSCCR